MTLPCYTNLPNTQAEHERERGYTIVFPAPPTPLETVLISDCASPEIRNVARDFALGIREDAFALYVRIILLRMGLCLVCAFAAACRLSAQLGDNTSGWTNRLDANRCVRRMDHLAVQFGRNTLGMPHNSCMRGRPVDPPEESLVMSPGP